VLRALPLIDKQWPGVYKEEIAINRSREMKAQGYGLLGGIATFALSRFAGFPGPIMRGGLTVIAGANTYFMANFALTVSLSSNPSMQTEFVVWYPQASTVKELALLKHSLLADAFCPTLVRLEKEPAVRKDMLNQDWKELGEWYSEMLHRCKRRAQDKANFSDESFAGGDPLASYVEAQEQTGDFEFGQPPPPSFDDTGANNGFGENQGFGDSGPVMNDPWSRR
jgi:hypothetical protein